MQVDELATGPAQQRGLHLGRADLELAARAAHPQEARVGQLHGQLVELAELVADDVEDAHARGSGAAAAQRWRSSRAASSAK